MCGTRIDKVREAELLDSSQPLKWARLNNFPQDVLQVIVIDIEIDKIVQGIANTLLFCHAPKPTHGSLQVNIS